MVLMSQLGARQNYLIAEMLYREDMLGLLVTDFWNYGKKYTEWCERVFGGSVVGRAMGRYNENIPNDKVRAVWSCRAFRSWIRSACGSGEASEANLVAVLSEFGRACAGVSDVPHSLFVGFCGESLEMLRLESKRGRRTVLDQYDTCREWEETLDAELNRNRALRHYYKRIPSQYYRRVYEEWELADTIVVNSEYSRSCIVEQGAAAEKVVTCPVMRRAQGRPRVRARAPGKPLRVLWVGRLCVVKGLLYAVRAAREMMGCSVEFTFVGRPMVDLGDLACCGNIHWVSHVPRSMVSKYYEDHDVFLFPTLSDGFGLVQVEAMGYGLPVIASTACGEVVQDGVSGYVVQPRSVESIVRALTMLVNDNERLSEMSRQAALRAGDFEPEAVWPRLRPLLLGV